MSSVTTLTWRGKIAPESIREAFQSNDKELSIKQHQARRITEEPHKTNLVKQYISYAETVIFHSIHGTIISFVLVSSLVSVEWSYPREQLHNFVVLSGLVLLIAVGLFMALNDWLRKLEYKEVYEWEKKRENWEVENYIEGERKEMVDLYTSKGLLQEDAEKVVKIYSKNPQFFVEVMMKEELELMPPDTKDPILNGFLLWVGVVGGGVIPLLPFFSLSSDFYSWEPNLASTVLSLVSLFITGSLRSNFTVSGWLKSGCLVTLMGLAPALLSRQLLTHWKTLAYKEQL